MPGRATTAAEQALAYVEDGAVIGLGSGRASTAFVHALAERVKRGLRIRGVPTSQATADLAAELGIPLATLDEAPSLDVAFDGADEVDPSLDLIKGYGGALVREKIVAASAKRFVVLVGSEKLVPVLGARGILPIEVVPFGEALCRRKLAELGLHPKVRMTKDRPYLTDNGNHILDCGLSPISDPAGLEQSMLSIPGVLGTGLFIRMADLVVIEDNGRVDIKEKSR